jgi:hypothetical protein
VNHEASKTRSAAVLILVKQEILGQDLQDLQDLQDYGMGAQVAQVPGGSLPYVPALI